MKQQIVIFVTGLGLGALALHLYRERQVAYVQKGDKGPEVQALQHTINLAAGVQLVPEDSLFSRETQNFVDQYFPDTSVYKAGAINRTFLQDLSLIYNKKIIQQ